MDHELVNTSVLAPCATSTLFYAHSPLTQTRGSVSLAHRCVPANHVTDPPCIKTPVVGQSLWVNSSRIEGWSKPALTREGHYSRLLRSTLADGYSFPRPLNASALAGQNIVLPKQTKKSISPIMTIMRMKYMVAVCNE